MSTPQEFMDYCPDKSNAGSALAFAHDALHAGNSNVAAGWIKHYLLERAGGLGEPAWNFIVGRLLPDHSARMETKHVYPPYGSVPLEIDRKKISVTVYQQGSPNHSA